MCAGTYVEEKGAAPWESKTFGELEIRKGEEHQAVGLFTLTGTKLKEWSYSNLKRGLNVSSLPPFLFPFFPSSLSPLSSVSPLSLPPLSPHFGISPYLGRPQTDQMKSDRYF